MFYPNIHPQYACIKKFVARTTLTTWTKKIPAINASTELNNKEKPRTRIACRGPRLVDLSQLYSNPFLQIRSFKQRIDPQISAHSSEPLTSEDKLEAIENISPKRLNVYGETEVCRIRQKQKVLSDIEIQTVCKRYQSGDSVYKLAKDFECHRSTISAVLKRNGVEVTHLASKKPELVKKVIELYAEMKTPKEVGTIVGLDCATVRQLLKDNGIYIRKAWEYPKGK